MFYLHEMLFGWVKNAQGKKVDRCKGVESSLIGTDQHKGGKSDGEWSAAANAMSTRMRSLDSTESDDEEVSSDLSSSSSSFRLQAGHGESESSGPDEPQWGDRLPDDLINNFCDKISAVMPSVDGFLAILSILLEPQRRPEEITGNKHVLQIILDQSLSHFVLLEWRADKRRVHLYDPFMPACCDASSISARLSQDFRNQIVSLFGHLYATSNGTADENMNGVGEDVVPIIVERTVELQTDSWSCGLRACGHLLLRLFDRNVDEYDMDLRQVLRFFVQIINTKAPSKEMFRDANFARRRNTARCNKPVRVLLNRNTQKFVVQVQRNQR